MESNKNIKVCFFDSGIGGLNLLYGCVRRYPVIDFTYFADNFRVPYGNMTDDELYRCVEDVFKQIDDMQPAAAVVACNTVTSRFIGKLRENYSFNIIGIQPAIKPAAQNGGNCIVLATPVTAASESLKNLNEKYGMGRTKIFACPDLSEYIENNIFNINKDKVIKALPKVKADSVVLGCTHYAFVKEIIKDYYNCAVFDGVEGTSVRLGEILGIFDHLGQRAQKIVFKGGDTAKNRKIFAKLLMQSGYNTQ